MLTPALACEPWLTGKGTEPPDKRCPVPLHCIGQCDLRLAFQGLRPSGQMICFDVDCPSPWWTGSYTENPTLIRASLSDVKVIMMVMRGHVVKLLCEAVMGWVLVLKCLLLGAHGCLWLRLVLSGIKWYLFSRTAALGPFS
jgi:hypothetical protein